MTTFMAKEMIEIGYYFCTRQDFINAMLVSKKFRHFVRAYTFNPIPDTSLFPHMKIQRMYSRVDKRIEGMPYILCYPITVEEYEKGDTHPTSLIFVAKNRIANNKKRASFGARLKIIWDRAFEKMDFKSIKINPKVHLIGFAAFRDCSKLLYIVLSSSLLHIAANAFERCKCLRAVDFPSSIRYIGDSAFRGCEGLKTVKFKSDTLCEFGKWVFCGCFSITNVECPDEMRKMINPYDGILIDVELAV
ncbi:hypothetical protein EIN_118230 [Entamoeba invadens IP1]|uniref:Leucine rich repeat containing protein BspA family protein n=1 Tax=Entamoeba invadens IP1 TaxID=370355 RepID=L7FNJ5_ENTIV|nr:hypothetical protein EIN_118230 [Entamoeba invadens IP1]ELP92249.1 hypothetical protein EIN_118230 [Entamoeba invadens IP1]|eukprot:XP_004259020.1 hypothetical protein EIN_118230 [Entamoeba invadens IP1]